LKGGDHYRFISQFPGNSKAGTGRGCCLISGSPTKGFMSRSTQYIGLNKFADDFLKAMSVLRTESWAMAVGMFDEPVDGRVFHMRQGYVLKEVVQCMPWSSGPMFFTHLASLDSDGKEIAWHFSWILDPRLKERNTEVDYEKGTYYV
jgi:hypothetical protein